MTHDGHDISFKLYDIQCILTTRHVVPIHSDNFPDFSASIGRIVICICS